MKYTPTFGIYDSSTQDGGKGSGNFGHAGVPGQVGGSAPTGGMGGVAGALDPNSEAAKKHTEMYYESVRKMKNDYKTIAKNTGLDEQFIKEVKEHIFIEEHDLENGRQRFEPDPNMAASWQRLLLGESHIQERDIILLHHEHLERSFMKDGDGYWEAHRKANESYNYQELT